MFGCQQNLISPDKYLKAILEFLCSKSSKLTNCGIYYARQMYFNTGKILSRVDLHKVLGTENRNLHNTMSQRISRRVRKTISFSKILSNHMGSSLVFYS